MTYALLDQKTNQLARHLQTLGVQRDVPVAVMMERSFDIIIAVMGESDAVPFASTLVLAASQDSLLPGHFCLWSCYRRSNLCTFDATCSMRWC